MARDLVEIFNSTFSPKTVWIENVAHSIAPHTVQPFEPDIAQRFLVEYPGLVYEYTIPEIPDIAGHKRVWIANGTGNPHLPETITLPARKEGEPPVTIPHPNREPVTLSWQIKVGETVIGSGDSQEARTAFNYPGPTLALPAYERVSVPEPIALQLLQRDGLQPPWRTGKVLRAREPAPFEPNRTWSIEDLLIYGRMIDEQYFSVERIAREFPSEEALKHDKKRIHEVKQDIWRGLFFRLIDRNYGRPPREAFEAAKRKVQSELTKPGSSAPAGRTNK